jgi:hypothetical protein
LTAKRLAAPLHSDQKLLHMLSRIKQATAIDRRIAQQRFIDVWKSFGLNATEWGGSGWRLIFLIILFSGVLVCTWKFKNETISFDGIFWWISSVLLCSLGILLTVPLKLKNWIHLKIPFFNVWLSLVFAVVFWFSAGLASNVLNNVFAIPSSLVPRAQIALTFAVAVAIAGMCVSPLAIVFQILTAISVFSQEVVKSTRALVVVSFFSMCFVFLYAGLIISNYVDISGTAKVYATQIALEFDFSDRVICKNLQDEITESKKPKFLFLDDSMNQVLTVLPENYLGTPANVSIAKKSGKKIELFTNPTVRACINQ